MMSWLDKFFSVFLGEEEKKEEKAVRPNEGPVARTQPVFEQHKEYKKIEDTKVYYEYPKGNFRFPLVPDEPLRDGVKQEEDAQSQASQRLSRRPMSQNKRCSLTSIKSHSKQSKFHHRSMAIIRICVQNEQKRKKNHLLFK